MYFISFLKNSLYKYFYVEIYFTEHRGTEYEIEIQSTREAEDVHFKNYHYFRRVAFVVYKPKLFV